MGDCNIVQESSVLMHHRLGMEEIMIGKLPLATALLAIGTIFGPTIATSAPTAPQIAITARTKVEQPLLQEVQWGYCRRWRHICADRYGWGGRHFYYCVRRHGC